MNIKNRLSKIEDSLNVNSEFCLCFWEAEQIEMRYERESYDAYSTGEYVPYQHSKQAKQREADESRKQPDELAEDCPNCGKTINKRIITIVGIG